MTKDAIKEYLKEIGKKGGEATKEKYGEDYFKRIAELPRKRKVKTPDETRTK